MVRTIYIYFIAIFDVCNIANTAAYRYGNQAEWGKISPNCNGNKQSPLNIVNASLQYASRYRPLTFRNYRGNVKRMTLKNDGHTVKIEGEWDSKFSIPRVSGGPLKGTYIFLGAHLHWGLNDNDGTEHAIGGHRFAAEMHFVHLKREYATLTEARKHNDGIVVLAHLMKKIREPINGKNNIITALTPLEDALPSIANGGSVRLKNVNLHSLKAELPYIYYSYSPASLTSPPCSNAVTFLIYPTIRPITELQLQLLRNVTLKYGEKSNIRDLQKVNGRKVLVNGFAN